MRDHKTITTDTDYDLTVHPAFASKAVVTRKGQKPKTLYEQDPAQPVDCSDGHPTKHVIKLKGKGNRRDITITVEDPNHTIHSLSLELYDEGRHPGKEGKWSASETFTVSNAAKTCPPYCDPT